MSEAQTIRKQEALPWVIPEQCEACADCVNACPIYSLEMWETANPDFSIPWLSNPDACIGCGKCEEACVWGAINMTTYVDEARARLFTRRPPGLVNQSEKRKFNLREAAADHKVVILTCLDSRLHVEDILQESKDNAFVLRNAGAAVTECVIRSMMLAIDALGAREIIIVGHRVCGLRTLDTRGLQKIVEDRVEEPARKALGLPFKQWLRLATDPEAHLKAQAELARQSRLIPRDVPVTLLMYDEYNGHIYQVAGPDAKVPV